MVFGFWRVISGYPRPELLFCEGGSMKVLLIGANGQLGTDVNRIFQDAIFQPGTP